MDNKLVHCLDHVLNDFIASFEHHFIVVICLFLLNEAAHKAKRFDRVDLQAIRLKNMWLCFNFGNEVQDDSERLYSLRCQDDLVAFFVYDDHAYLEQSVEHRVDSDLGIVQGGRHRLALLTLLNQLLQ